MNIAVITNTFCPMSPFLNRVILLQRLAAYPASAKLIAVAVLSRRADSFCCYAVNCCGLSLSSRYSAASELFL